MNVASPSPSKPPKKKKQKTKSTTKGKMAAAQLQQVQHVQVQDPGLNAFSGVVEQQLGAQHIQQVGNRTYHQLQPVQSPIQTSIQMQPQFQNFQSSPPQLSPQWAQDIISQLGVMNQKLEKLDTIESSLSSMKREIKTLHTRVVEVEKSQEFISKSLEDNDKNTSQTLNDLSDLKLALETSMKENTRLAENILDLQCRSMRDNLLFYGIEEARAGEQENCEDIVKEICESKLEINTGIEIERAHRIGKKNYNKPRPIVVKFSRYPQREAVRKSAHKLKNTDISIGEQFPKEVQDRRKSLFPVYKKAKEDQKKAVLVKDKLYIDGKLYVKDASSEPVKVASGDHPRGDGRGATGGGHRRGARGK
uniref:Uncharacterized protein LOC111117757 n=1 Tax=Crassostrea virginica TaxID=6565 RepID=A0A8B8CAM5_CRAVI|nr:uncharacterized protein LOC111117757 [Crassostrea virginica]